MKIIEANLLNGDTLKFGDFNVFIGGNGVGKTTIISELFHRISELQKAKYWWIEKASYASDDQASDMAMLYKSLNRKRDGVNLFWYSQAVKNIDGNIDLSDDIRFSDKERDAMVSQLDPVIFNQKRYRRPFISFSSCESRLSLQNESSITRLDNPPQGPINVLYRNKTLLSEIDKNIFEIYKKHFVILSHIGTAIQIGIAKEQSPIFDSNAESKQDEFEKIEKWKQEKFTPITEAGHGIRSMIRLLTSLLEPVNQIILIDEPEIHVYPSQKVWLGKQLVSLASKRKKQVFLVTHDPMILQGILDENTKTNIFRIDRDNEDKGIIRVCEFDKVKSIPSRNQDQYLQGLFYQRCIVVEGANDRAFYQGMIEEYPETQDKDMGFVVAGSVSHSKHVVEITAKVGLKVAFIYDLDVLFQNIDFIKEIFTTLGGSSNPIEKLEEAFNEDSVVKNAVGDEKNKAIKRFTGFKRRTGFDKDWENAHQNAINDAFVNLANKGIFIVPNGTLESWAPDLEESAKFAEKAPNVINGTKELKEKFNDFSKKVLNYLEIKLN
jgi:ABC-type cobalamin/Fe3+-siderophores transport system ATPase subunit